MTMNEQPRHRVEKARTSGLVRGLCVVTLLVVAAVSITGFSSARFTASSASTGFVSAAADWTPPTVALQAPGTPVRGTVTVTATASDAESGIKNVAIQYRAAEGAGWTTVCTDTTTPYSCAWNTTSVADGAYTLRAVATDNAGYTTASSTVSTTVANSLTVVLASPATVVRGAPTLSTTISGAGSVTPQVRVEYSPVGSSTWTTACTVASAPYDCSWTTTALPNGSYDLRSVAVAGSTTYTSATVRTLVDNQAPTVTMTDPGSPLSGTRTFTATAADSPSGVAQVVIQHATGSTWSTLCTIASSPYSCTYDTTKLPNGTYGFRAVATDVAGNSTTSATVTGRTISNVVSTVTLNDPGTYLRGSVSLTATGTSTGTISSVRIQRAPTGSSTWTDVCTKTAAPYTCSLATTSLADGAYDLRAVLLDSSGQTVTSAVVSSRIVDNTAGRGIDVQTTNGGTAGRIDSGDTLVLTYSERVNTATVKSGWDGSATDVSVRVRDGLLLNLSLNDVLDVPGTNLGSIALNADFIGLLSTGTATASMTASTETVNGVDRTVVTLRITQNTTMSTTSAATMVWTPSAAVTDLAGNPFLTTAVTESGANDRDF